MGVWCGAGACGVFVCVVCVVLLVFCHHAHLDPKV